MNLIVPFFLFPLIFINGIDSPKYLDDKMVIGSINTQDERLKQIELNSELVSINDIEIKTWENFLDIKDEKLNSIILIEYIHNNKIKTYEFDNAKKFNKFKAAFSPALSNELGGIMKNSLAEINDFRKGDRIIKINNVEINKWSDIKQTLLSSKSEKFDFMIQRNDQIINKELVFKADKDKIIGISPNIITVKKEFSLEEVISNSFDKSIMSIKLIFNGITGIFAKLFSSDSDVSELKKNLAGPIAIAKYSGEAAQKGFNSVIQFIIIISVNLGIINLLPIPLLDGGHITINTIEGILRRRINPKIIGFLNKVGFALLISLMIFAVYNDIINF